MYCVRLFTSLFALALLGAAGLTTANAQGQSAFMQVLGKTTQPIGHHDLCARMPVECRERTADDRPVVLTPVLWNELIAVNDNVNTAIVPDTDKDIYGREEFWAYPDTLGKGDCEDFVLLKRRELMQRGWPAGSLLITVVRQTNGDGHAVLTVRTDRGDLVLDNLEGKIKLWEQTDYQFIKRQSDTDSGRWVSIADDRNVLVGSIKR
ncbi:Predicted transglutaminase-like cysteine proteinase [Kaistia soli DSM 19436]|uniref:Predicted transglutaminase-like cysteine proteinase n=1 Tax=Kaistia soli DSM 19436 TaxID=1122133 RepID=A0A1M5AJ01_9HYPH|nr:transglutaminase-like cysteine peptidase [Kaistia soli]SHF30125.1 Predicted transglutaminase-like cysteine proteinase [Kaistia soli DSM 19436]